MDMKGTNLKSFIDITRALYENVSGQEGEKQVIHCHNISNWLTFDSEGHEELLKEVEKGKEEGNSIQEFF